MTKLGPSQERYQHSPMKYFSFTWVRRIDWCIVGLATTCSANTDFRTRTTPEAYLAISVLSMRCCDSFHINSRSVDPLPVGSNFRSAKNGWVSAKMVPPSNLIEVDGRVWHEKYWSPWLNITAAMRVNGDCTVWKEHECIISYSICSYSNWFVYNLLITEVKSIKYSNPMTHRKRKFPAINWNQCQLKNEHNSKGGPVSSATWIFLPSANANNT